MAVLLIAMSVMAIMMTVALPTWRQAAQREKEEELVFRGEQYARALSLFQMKNGPGTSPPNVDLLVDQRFLRKKYKDPITNSDFVPLQQVVGQGQGPGQGPGQGNAAQQPGGRGSATAGRGGAGGGGFATPGATSGTPAGSAAGGAAVGGIVGFTSKSKAESIRIYKGRTHYNEWQFMPVARAAAPGQGGQAAPGVGGQRGGRGNPGAAPTPFGGGGGRQGQPGGGRFGNPPAPPPAPPQPDPRKR